MGRGCRRNERKQCDYSNIRSLQLINVIVDWCNTVHCITSLKHTYGTVRHSRGTWEPFVAGPEFAMDTVNGRSCLHVQYGSLLQMLGVSCSGRDSRYEGGLHQCFLLMQCHYHPPLPTPLHSTPLHSISHALEGIIEINKTEVNDVPQVSVKFVFEFSTPNAFTPCPVP